MPTILPNAMRSIISTINPLQLTAHRVFSMTIFVLATIAFGFSSYLFSVALSQNEVAGCSGNLFDCNSVLQSRWSTWFGIPVSGLAAASYLVFLAAWFKAEFGKPQTQKLAWMLVSIAGFSASLAGIWFIGLQMFVLKHWCMYCLFAHCCGLSIGAGLLLRRPLGWQGIGLALVFATAGLGMLVTGQLLGEEKESFQIIDFDNQETEETSPIQSPNETEESIFDAPDLDDFDFDFSLINEPQASPRPRSHQLSDGHSWQLQVGLFMAGAWTHQSVLVAPGLTEQPDGQPKTTISNQFGQLDGDQDQDQADQEEANQANQTQADQDQAPSQTERRLAEILNGRVKLDITQWPMAGSKDATLAMVEMFDYNCSHCRATHVAVKAAKERLGDQLAIIVMPVPLNTACNNQIQQTAPQFFESCEVAKLAIAVWRVDQDKFLEFHDWMFEGSQPRSLNAAKQYAENLVDADKLERVLASTLPAAFVKKHVEVYQKAGGGTIPKLLFRTTGIVGEYRSADSLVDMINRHGNVSVVPIETKE